MRDQKKHHAQGKVYPILERTSDGAPRLIRESRALYVVPDPEWQREMEEMEE